MYIRVCIYVHEWGAIWLLRITYIYIIVDNISWVRSSIAPWKLFIQEVKVFVDRDFWVHSKSQWVPVKDMRNIPAATIHWQILNRKSFIIYRDPNLLQLVWLVGPWVSRARASVILPCLCLWGFERGVRSAKVKKLALTCAQLWGA